MTNTAALVYVFDTSAMVAAWNEQYPPDLFPSVWKRLEHLIEQGRLIAPEEVLTELARQDDGLHGWAKKRKTKIFKPLSEPVQLKVSEVLNLYPRLTSATGNHGLADPWVIGLAAVSSGVVVTQETPAKSEKKYRIPDACDGFKLPWCPLVEVVRREGWSF